MKNNLLFYSFAIWLKSKFLACCLISRPSIYFVFEPKFYSYYSTKIAKAVPGFDDRPEHPSVQINSSSPCPSIAGLTSSFNCIQVGIDLKHLLHMQDVIIRTSRAVRGFENMGVPSST